MARDTPSGRRVPPEPPRDGQRGDDPETERPAGDGGGYGGQFRYGEDEDKRGQRQGNDDVERGTGGKPK